MGDKDKNHKKGKGILKKTPGFHSPEPPSTSANTDEVSERAAHFDEMNIIETLHPADKDYGTMKVTEPDTPFNYEYDGEHKAIEVDDLRGKLEKLPSKTSQLSISAGPNPEQPAVAESDDNLTDEEKNRRKEFEKRRKQHYNEYTALLDHKKKSVPDDTSRKKPW